MPAKKGRKRRVRDRRHAESGDDRPAAALPSTREEEALRPPSSDLPKVRVRMAGFVLAVITLFLGILNVVSGLGDGSAAVLVTGVLLIALSIVLGVLALVPKRVRSLLTKK